jgi:hypothetical protein
MKLNSRDMRFKKKYISEDKWQEIYSSAPMSLLTWNPKKLEVSHIRVFQNHGEHTFGLKKRLFFPQGKGLTLLFRYS